MKLYIFLLFYIAPLYIQFPTQGKCETCSKTDYIVPNPDLPTNYCDPTLCPNVKHIGCENNDEFSRSCPDDANLVSIDESFQEFILNEMNNYRNFIAGGRIKHHKPACRMASMRWSKELAKLASLHVKQCEKKPDSCHNTDEFKNSGQNVAIVTFGTDERLEDVIKRCIQSWFDEVAYSKMSNIRQYPMNYIGPEIGHFTLMIAERNTHVGCGASTFSYQMSTKLLFTCNFAVNNVIGSPVYKDCCKPASSCLRGVNMKYPKLCSPCEWYPVNRYFPPKEQGNTCNKTNYMVPNPDLPTNYCDPTLCPNVKHIGCENNDEFSRSCPDDANLVSIDESFQELILNEMNNYRNFIAGGRIKYHKPACRMAPMRWSKELAKLASLHVKQCEKKPDSCHNTDEFKNSGQNVAIVTLETDERLEDVIKRCIQSWFDEVAYSNMSNIRQYPMNYIGPEIGHFTLMIAERNTHVGCGASTFSYQMSIKFLFTCNFAVSNVIGSPVYKDCCKPASSCLEGVNIKYPNLCSPCEWYPVNRYLPLKEKGITCNKTDYIVPNPDLPTNYCDPTLCPNVKHIGCENNDEFSRSCPDDANLVSIDDILQKLILYEMNNYRNFIAGGRIKYHKPACRMAPMRWSKELAKLASLHVKQCEKKPDSCHNTDEFKNSGQNVAIVTLETDERVEDVIKRCILSWFDEVVYSNMSNIRQYPMNYIGPEIGHFTLMVAERNTHVGCGASTFSHQMSIKFLFTCNFAVNNVIGSPVYKDCCYPAYSCLKGVNIKYPNLCSPCEWYPVNRYLPPKEKGITCNKTDYIVPNPDLPTNYCDPTLCPNVKHIGCENKDEFSRSCPDDANLVSIDESFQEFILNTMNNYRSAIAGGDIKHHKPACRMASMRWSKELAKLASLHVKQCEKKPDSCHNTDEFKNSGQNVAIVTLEADERLEDVIKRCIQSWFDEVAYSNMSNIRQYPMNYIGPEIGHFTLMVAERNTHVGCGASTFSYQMSIKFLFTCNFAVSNVIGNPIYMDCLKPATCCKRGVNIKYPNLCSLLEWYPVNNSLPLEGNEVCKNETEDMVPNPDLPTYYCDPTLCPNAKHIGCENNDEFSRSCPDDANLVSIDESFQEFILNTMNNYRSAIAGGDIKHHKPACRMASMRWSKELAKLASLHVKQCEKKPDSCHNTDEFKNSGQNVAIVTLETDERLEDVIKRCIQSWFDEVAYSNMSNIRQFPMNNIGPEIGHFTLMVAERNTHVGCGASTLSYQMSTKLLFTCNFAVSNVIGNPIYMDCLKPAICCKRGVNMKYPNLCSLLEWYPVNSSLPLEGNEECKNETDDIVSKLKIPTEYCDPILCPNNVKHIGCKNNLTFASSCPNDAVFVSMSNAFQRIILDEINKYRNFIAGGGIENLKPACRMATMQWDDDLANLALLNVKECQLKYDDCHNTHKYRYSGQIMKIISITNNDLVENAIIDNIKLCLAEVFVGRNIIEKYPMSYSGQAIGDFLIMVAEKNTHIGCAASMYSYGHQKNFLLACNTAVNKVWGSPIFSNCSNSGTLCKSGTDKFYSNLCSPSEQYAVNSYRTLGWKNQSDHGSTTLSLRKGGESNVTFDYCDTILCPNGQHINCNSTKRNSKSCPKDASLIHIPEDLQSVILKTANKYRDFIAGGGDENLKPACRMATIEWDNELAQLAELFVMNCQPNYENCHNTFQFRFSGQVVEFMTIMKHETTNETIIRGIKSWYDELLQYGLNMRAERVINNFVLMIAEKNTHIGCAASKFSDGYDKQLLLVCNTAVDENAANPIYKICWNSGILCTSGTNPSYPNLCSTSEDYNKWIPMFLDFTENILNEHIDIPLVTDFHGSDPEFGIGFEILK